jgi:hypothetical protein
MSVGADVQKLILYIFNRGHVTGTLYLRQCFTSLPQTALSFNLSVSCHIQFRPKLEKTDGKVSYYYL